MGGPIGSLGRGLGMRHDSPRARMGARTSQEGLRSTGTLSAPSARTATCNQQLPLLHRPTPAIGRKPYGTTGKGAQTQCVLKCPCGHSCSAGVRFSCY